VSWAIWITGLPGSGKSAVAAAAAARLRERGEPVVHLELDAVRRVLTPSPTYGAGEREVVYRALVYLAGLLTATGTPVLIDATAHRRAWRDRARASLGHFAEVQLDCPLDVAVERARRRRAAHAPADVYAHAGRPGATVPGVDVPYERALAPDLVIDTVGEDVPAAAARVVALAATLAAAAQARPGGPAPRWAIWITGRPGSGKTTLASSVADDLTAHGVVLRVLDPVDVREALLDGRAAGEHEEDILHRTLVYGAKLLTEAGVPVLIDATAPRRAWRELARAMIAHFAEVQLRCPPEVCDTRERAVRWNLAVCAQGAQRKRVGAETPDIVLDYEESLRPELTLHTDCQHPWSAAEAIVQLARRLHGLSEATPLERSRA
jgi:adenylylsulfate kinase